MTSDGLNQMKTIEGDCSNYRTHSIRKTSSESVPFIPGLEARIA
jgi:hypothetical protein